MKIPTLFSSLLITLLLAAVSFGQTVTVVSGADNLLANRMDLIRGKRVGLVTNHSALLANGHHLVDSLAHMPDVKLVALFGPEHGIRGDAPDGRTVREGIDPVTGVPVYSLYGKVTKPNDEMLKNVDVLLYDIQDVGVRFYTFVSTMCLSMEAAAEKHIPFVVLDRPDPIRGTAVDGPVRLDSLKSFVGWAPIPVMYGMTIGELAQMVNGEGWLEHGVKANLVVVPMTGWKRGLWYDETGLAWTKPSPNITTMNTEIVYPGTCFIEGTNVSEGRGTLHPFEYLGAPWLPADRVAALLNSAALPGVRFDTVRFTPVDIPHVASDPKYKGMECRGISINLTDRNTYEPVVTGVAILAALRSAAPDSFVMRSRIDRLTGTPLVRTMIMEGKSAGEIAASWKDELAAFNSVREKYLLYR